MAAFRKYGWLLLLPMLALGACHRKTCPAYMGGKSTGTQGSKGRPRTLFSPRMSHHHHSIFYIFKKHKTLPAKKK